MLHSPKGRRHCVRMVVAPGRRCHYESPNRITQLAEDTTATSRQTGPALLANSSRWLASGSLVAR